MVSGAAADPKSRNLSITPTEMRLAKGWRLDDMPRKIRELMRDLERAGFVNRGGKGDHRNFEHEKGLCVTISGQLGADAKPYQEREVRERIQESKR